MRAPLSILSFSAMSKVRIMVTSDQVKVTKKATMRDGNVELFRVLLTFGIVWLHSIGFGMPGKEEWLRSMLLPCVVGFVFISGWYGVRFSFKKIVRLYGVVGYAILIGSLVRCLWQGGGISLRLHLWVSTFYAIGS